MFGKKKKSAETEIKIVAKPDDFQTEDKYSDFKEDERLTPEEAQAKIALILAETKNPEILSELDQEEIAILASMQTLADQYDLKVIKTFITKFLLFRVSHKRQGRKEVIEIGKGRKEEQQMRRGLKQMILGLR